MNIGGPVFIPKVYDGRNKTFFFIAGERSRAKNYSSSGLQSLPIADFRNGDFRRYTDATGKMIPLYDPFDANGNIIANANDRQPIQLTDEFAMIKIVVQDEGRYAVTNTRNGFTKTYRARIAGGKKKP